MIGLDTNVVVRYLVQDDALQSATATRLIERTLAPENPGLITIIVLCEIVWVLAESYGAGRERIATVLRGLLSARQIVVERADLAWRALRAWERSPADFSDALVGELVAASGGSKTLTFDKSAAKLPGFELLS